MSNTTILNQRIHRAALFAAVELCNYCIVNNRHTMVLGVSGGLDSAVVLAIAKLASELAEVRNYTLTPIGFILPCESKPEATELAKKALAKCKVEYIYTDLSAQYQEIVRGRRNLNLATQTILDAAGNSRAQLEWDWHERVAHGNIKARLRMIELYDRANMCYGLVLSTDNLSENLMGFWTLHGDVGDFGPIQNIFKGLELYVIAKTLEVPDEIIAAKPDDGLGVAGTDEDQLGAPYPVIDMIMVRLIQKGFEINGSPQQVNDLPDIDGFEKKLVRQLAIRCLNNKFKRLQGGCVAPSRRILDLPEIEDMFQ